MAAGMGAVLVDRELYLPQECAVDGPRCREAGGIEFAAKPELPRPMLDQALDAGASCG